MIPRFKPSIYAACACLLTAFLSAAPLHAETYHFDADTKADTSAGRAVAKPFAGLVRINHIAIPAYTLNMENPVNTGRLDFIPKQRSYAFTSSATPAQIQQLAAYYHSNGWILVPRKWQLTNGGVGANGSESLMFAANHPEQGYIAYFNTSACVGCAQSAAAVFFPEAKKDALANDFVVADKTDFPVTTTRVRPHLMAYRVQKPQQRIDGLAYYNKASDQPFWKVETMLPAAMQDLAPVLLNWFMPKK